VSYCCTIFGHLSVNRFAAKPSASNSGISSGAKDAVTSSGISSPGAFIHYINAAAHPIVLEHGLVKKPAGKDATRWGANGLIKIPEPDPSLTHVFKEAQAAATLDWSRWQLITGRRLPFLRFRYRRPNRSSKSIFAVSR
jgi:hypothetical protein